MKKKVFALLVCGLPLLINAQDAFDVLQMSETELRGTSRFQSMAGAFGALGGDISTLTQNPAGIGVYRNSDLGVTFSLDFNSAKAGVETLNETKFNVNNLGYVGVIRLDSETMQNLNFGFTYNRLKSFNRHYKGAVLDIPQSMSNFIAEKFVNINPYGPFTTDDLTFEGDAPWAAVTTYDMKSNNVGKVGIINDNGFGGMQGIFGEYDTFGDAYYEVDERGHVDEYNIAFGGNFNNKVYLGLDFGIIDLDFRSSQTYEEDLTNPYLKLEGSGGFIYNNTHAEWGLYNDLHREATGVNFKLGLIWRPTQALRLGAAFHTPTYYKLSESYRVGASLNAYENGAPLYTASKDSPNDYLDYNIKTPWHFLGSIAGVIGAKGIISMDYEYVNYTSMRMGDDRNDWADVTEHVKEYFKPSHIIRIGGEYRVNPSWSLRAGYSVKTTEVEAGVDEYEYNIATAHYNPAYQYDNTVHNITCGLGYRYKSFYTDLAYVHNIRNSVYNAFSIINYYDGLDNVPNVSADVVDHNNRVSLTMGVRF